MKRGLNHLVRFYAREGRKCRKAKAHLASVIMFGSALETCLILMVSWYEDEIPEHILPMAKKETKPLLNWKLHELLVIVRDCGWLPAGLRLGEDWDHKRAKVGDYAIAIKETRNCVHPARALADLPKGHITKRHSKLAAAVFEAAVDHLEVKGSQVPSAAYKRGRTAGEIVGVLGIGCSAPPMAILMKRLSTQSSRPSFWC